MMRSSEPAETDSVSAGVGRVDSWNAVLANVWSRLQADDHDGARSELKGLAAVRPNHAEIQLNIGFLASRLSEAELAEEGYRLALGPATVGSTPAVTVAALVNLTSLLIGQSRFEDAHNELVNAQASAMAPTLQTVPEFHFNMGTCTTVLGDRKEAAAHLRKAMSLRPTYIEAARNLALLLLEDRRYEESAAILGDMIDLGAENQGALYGLARLALFDVEGAIEQFRLAEPTDVPTEKQEESRLRQEAEQDAYLERLDSTDRAVTWSGDPVVGTRPTSEWVEIDTELAGSRRSVVVLDDVLTDDALSAIRHELLTRRIWRGATAPGEVITTLERGLADSPIVFQLANELRAALPESIGKQCLTEAWAYQYRDYEGCTQAHGDSARYSVNLWLTPDDANLGSPEGGGLRLWSDRAFEYVPTVGSSESQLLTNMSDQRNDADIVVPYRCNRAVVFDALTVHETDAFRFRPEFENRRINMTLLFGWPH